MEGEKRNLRGSAGGKNGARGGRRQRTAAVWMHKSADDGDAVGTQIE